MNKNILTLLVLAFIFLTMTNNGCKKEENPVNSPVDIEHAPATTVTMYLIRLDNNGNPTADTAKATVRDTSVVRGKSAIEGILNLKGGTTYKGIFKLIDESVSPSEDITQSIINEQDAHEYVFSISNNLVGKLSITNISLDNNKKPFGQTFQVIVNPSVTGSGFIHVILQHHDSGNKDDNVYDSDLDRDFPLTIEP